MYLQCENEFCVYWEPDYGCWLDDVELDALGRCTSCILLDVEKAALDEARARADR